MAAKKNWKSTVLKYVGLLRREIPVDRVIVFGSFAHGMPKPYSDIDVAIFSKHFKDRDEIANMQYLFKKACVIDPAIEPHPYHPRELRAPRKGTLLYEIVKTGKVLV